MGKGLFEGVGQVGGVEEVEVAILSPGDHEGGVLRIVNGVEFLLRVDGDSGLGGSNAIQDLDLLIFAGNHHFGVGSWPEVDFRANLILIEYLLPGGAVVEIDFFFIVRDSNQSGVRILAAF